MKYLLSIVLSLLSINCFSQNDESDKMFIENIKHSLDVRYKEYYDYIRETLDEYGVQDIDTMIIIPTFYASEKYTDIAQNRYKKAFGIGLEKLTGLKPSELKDSELSRLPSEHYVEITKSLDFEEATRLKRTDLFLYINYDSPSLTDVMIYRSNHFSGIFSQSEIKKEWRNYISAENELLAEGWRRVGRRLYELSPEYVFYLNNIGHNITFFIKDDEIFCYFTMPDKIIPLSEGLNDISVEDFAHFLNVFMILA